MMDDAQLIGRFVESKDSGAFGALVERHVGLVYRTALRLVGGDAHRAEDVAQVVFVLLARKAEALRGRGSVAGWLYEATRRIARDVRRSEERRKRREEGVFVMSELLGNGVGAGASDAEARTDWETLRPVLDEALGELSAAEREVVLLRFFGGKAFGEIGAALRLSEDAARMRAGRALEKLRGLLERRGVKSTSAALGVLIGSDAALGAPVGLAVTVSQGAMLTVAAGGAGVALGVGAGFGAIGFMSVIKTVGVVAVLAITALVAVRELRAKREAEGVVTPVRSEYAAMVEKAEAAERRAREAEGILARGRAESVVLREKAEAQAREEGDALMAAHPPLRAALLASHRAQVAADAYLSCARLQLSEERRREVLEILQKGEPFRHRWGDQYGGAEVLFFIPAELSAGEMESRLRRLVGDAGYALIAQPEVRAFLPHVVGDVAKELFENEVPLGPEQRLAFIDVFTQAVDATGKPAGWVEMQKIERASAFLTERQVQVLKAMEARKALRRGELPKS
jgi:RNA polymerase sigma factor (sigma-70 family)